MGNSRVWTGKWKGGRTFNGKDGRPVYVLRKMVQGRSYTVYLDARSKTEAEAELALFLREPEGYRTRPRRGRRGRRGPKPWRAGTYAG